MPFSGPACDSRRGYFFLSSSAMSLVVSVVSVVASRAGLPFSGFALSRSRREVTSGYHETKPKKPLGSSRADASAFYWWYKSLVIM